MSDDPVPAKAEGLGGETPAVTPAVPAAMAGPVLGFPDVPATPAAPLVPPAVPAGAVTEAPAPPAVPAPPVVPAAPGSPATPVGVAPPRRRRLVVLAGLGRVLRFALMVALLVGGIILGYTSFQRSRPPAPVSGDPVTAGVAAPAIVQEFVTALARNDPDAVRSAVPTDPYKLLTSEMQTWQFATVTSVETLSTYVDGPRSSTAIILIGTSSTGNPVSINLIVHADAGKIVSFR